MCGREKLACAPTWLGFVKPVPSLSLTPAGETLVTARRTEEVFLRQLLKYQLPSPFHVPTEQAATFRVKPYLELFRLIRHFGTLRFDELRLFALQLTDYRRFDEIVQKIETFRTAKAQHTGSYKTFVGEYLTSELRVIYAEELAAGLTATRESRDRSERKFLNTKGSNLHDYADACIRYLRATGMVSVSHAGRSLSIIKEKEADVDFFLSNVSREPVSIADKERYTEYLGNPALPELYTDDRDRLISKLREEFPATAIDTAASTETLKTLYADLLEERKAATIEGQVKALKDYREYDDIQEKYSQILDGTLYDAPLMLEWNTWRAMTMLDGGDVKANLNFDDYGQPLSTAQGNMADIVCDYGDFNLCVEVTMSSGQRQYEMEHEPVSRHVGKLRRESGKPSYCLFIAPEINEACVTTFFTLHAMNISYYGGHSTIVPLPLTVFQKMVEDSRKAAYVPQPKQVRDFFEYSNRVAASGVNEAQWFELMKQKALHWLE